MGDAWLGGNEKVGCWEKRRKIKMDSREEGGGGAMTALFPPNGGIDCKLQWKAGQAEEAKRGKVLR